jgi:hypothetical protein
MNSITPLPCSLADTMPEDCNDLYKNSVAYSEAALHSYSSMISIVLFSQYIQLTRI